MEWGWEHQKDRLVFNSFKSIFKIYRLNEGPGFTSMNKFSVIWQKKYFQSAFRGRLKYS